MTYPEGGDAIREMAMLGLALLSAQKVEFILYGAISHLSGLSDAKDKRLRTLDPKVFLRGELDDLKLTLGQLVDEFGDKLLLTSEDLEGFVDDRNLIAHNYYRLTKTNIKGGPRLENPEEFLTDFIGRCNYWESVLRGLVQVMRRSIADQNGVDITFTEEDIRYIQCYEEHAEVFLRSKE